MSHDILILRDPRESWARCSLAPLRGKGGVRFVGYRPELELDGEGRILLEPDAPVLEPGESGRGLLLLDSSWRRLSKLRATIRGEVVARSLPPLVTAYPRKSRTFPDPSAGLASIEALFAACCLMGHRDLGLLEGYRFAGEFLRANPGLAPDSASFRSDSPSP